ncbi:MAG: RNA polymerase sigma factor [Myxococcales bacterium]|nr:RNA polymerase sigma factor [Myxococcales bacterium]
MTRTPTPPPLLFPIGHQVTEDDIRVAARLKQTVPRGSTAFDLVVRCFGEKLKVHAVYILRDTEEAHDVVQEVFIKAMREPRFFDADFKMQAWLYRVTRNLCFNLVRDRRRRDVLLRSQPGAGANGVPGRGEDPVDAVFNGERQREVLAVVELLSEDHRSILMLRYYGDHSYAEIADRLGIKLGTVMSRLSRARDRLMVNLGGDAAMLEAS